MNDLMTKSFLNYVDLKKEAIKDLEAGPDLEMAFQDTTLDRFFEEVNRIKGEMEGIQDLLPRLHDANEEGKTTHKPDALKSLHVRINAYITTILKKARLIRSKLEELDRENQANRRLSGFREGTPIDRTRTSVTNGLRRKLKELMMEFQDLRQKIMSEYKQTVERRYFTITGENPDEEVIEKIISTGDSEDLLKNAIQEQGRGKVLATVYEIQDRHDAAKEIEKSLLELHQVFLDMAVMVETQAEQLDDIEQHVINTANYVKGGAQELSTAKKYQKSNRKWLCIGMIILLILVLLVVVPIATSLHKA